MPTIEKKLKPREKQTIARFKNAVKQSEILCDFFNKGFTSLTALHAIVSYYYEEVSYNQLFEFWNFKSYNKELAEKLINVFEKLKAE